MHALEGWLSRGRPAGFTLVELLITMVLGVLIVSALLAFTTSSLRNLDSNRGDEEIARSARFVGMALEQDLQEVGVSLESRVNFGSLAALGDTVVIVRVPFEPQQAPAHALVPPPGTDNPLPPGGTCGTYCVTIDITSGLDLAVGDVARLQVSGERRIILVQGVTAAGTEAQITFTAHNAILGQPAGLSGGLLLDRFNTFVQKLQITVYYRDGDRLMRAERLDPTAAPIGSPLIYGLQSWEAFLVFTDGDELDEANPNDADATNDYDDLVGIRIQAELAGDHPLLRGASGFEVTSRPYEWKFAPRNLTYERNRLTS